MPPQPKYHSLEQVQVLGKELLDYIDTRAAAGNHIYHMCEWYWDVKKMSALEWDSLRGRDSFVQHYENARKKVFLGMMRDKNLSTAYGSRFLAMYSSELRLKKSKTRSNSRKLTLSTCRKRQWPSTQALWRSWTLFRRRLRTRRTKIFEQGVY